MQNFQDLPGYKNTHYNINRNNKLNF